MSHRRLVRSIVLAAFALVLVAAPAEAGRKWCQKDPAFQVAGTRVSVDVAVYDDLQTHVTGPIAVTLYVPPGTAAELVFTDDGFNGYGEVATILTDERLRVTGRGIQIRVVVVVPASVSMPAIGTVYPGSGRPVTVNGKTNNSITINASVSA